MSPKPTEAPERERRRLRIQGRRREETHLDTISTNSPSGPYAVYAVFCTTQGRPTVTLAHLQGCQTPPDTAQRDKRNAHADVVETDRAIDVQPKPSRVRKFPEVRRSFAFIFITETTRRSPISSTAPHRAATNDSPSRLNWQALPTASTGWQKSCSSGQKEPLGHLSGIVTFELYPNGYSSERHPRSAHVELPAQ